MRLYKSQDQINSLINNLSVSLIDKINDYDYKKVIVVPVMNASMFFAVDICRKLFINGIKFEISSINISSYKGTHNSQPKVLIDHDDFGCMDDTLVVLLDTVADTGKTIETASAYIEQFYPMDILTCCLLKRNSCKTPVDCVGDYIISDEFLVGYGLDYNGEYRELPYIGYIDKGNL